jgi:hypothetical protein
MINLGNLGGLFNGGINPSAGTGSKVDLGALINAGIGLLNKKPSAGPVAVAKENDWVPVESKIPAWLWPVLIVGAIAIFGKKIFK